MKAFITCVFVVLFCSLALAQDCGKYQSSCDACSKAGCRFVWNAEGFYNSSKNASCLSVAEFQRRASANQYPGSKSIWAWALYDSEIKTKMGQRLIKVQTTSAYAYHALPIPCYDAHRSICRQPVGAVIGRTCDGYDNSSLAGVNITCSATRGDGTTVSTTSSDRGFFVFLKLRAGTYRCIATYPGTYLTYPFNITIKDRSNTSAEVCLQPLPAAITGRVYDVTTGQTLPGSVVDCNVTDTFKTIFQWNSTFTTTGTYLFQGIRVFGRAACIASNNAGGYAVNSNSGITVRGRTITIDIPLTPNPGRLFGFSYITGSKEPVSGVNITCTALGKTYTNFTDAKGAYDFGVVPNATYTCTSYIPGYQILVFLATPEVKRGGSTQQDFPLAPLPAVIRGEVYDSESENSLSGAKVDCEINDEEWANTTTTVQGGQYIFSPVFTYGVAYCNASLTGYAPSSFYANTTQRGMTTIIDIPLSPLPSRLWGFVYVNGTTTPVVDANVTCVSGSTVYTRKTNSSGAYDFNPAKNGTYQCTATAADFFPSPSVEVFVPQATSIRRDFNLRVAVGDLIVQVVESFTDRQVFLNGSDVVLLARDGSVVATAKTAGRTSLAHFTRVRPGLYSVNASYADYTSFLRSNINVDTAGACTNSSALCPNGTVLLELTAKNSTIYGRVLNSVNGLGIDTAQIELVIVRASGISIARDTTDDRGGFNLIIMPDKVGGFGDVINWTLTVIKSGFDEVSQSVVVPGPNTRVGPITFRLNVTTTGNVLGKVVQQGSSQTVIEGVLVTITDTPGQNFTVRTNSSGYFFFRRVPAGTRRLSLSHPLYNPLTNQPLTVGAGDPGTSVTVFEMGIKVGIVDVYIWDKSDPSSPPGDGPHTLSVPELGYRSNPITGNNVFKNVELPIGNRNFTVVTPMYKLYWQVVTIVEGRNPDLRFLMEYSPPFKK